MSRQFNNHKNNRGPSNGRPDQHRGPSRGEVAGRGRFGSSKVGQENGFFNCSLEQFRIKLQDSLARTGYVLDDKHVTVVYGDERDNKKPPPSDFNASNSGVQTEFYTSTIAPPPGRSMQPTIDEEENEDDFFPPADPFRETLWANHLEGKGNGVVLTFGSESIRVSKAVLAASSFYFESALSSAVDEVLCDAPFVEPKVAQALVEFMYRGRLDGFNERRANDLYDAAYQWGIRELATACIRVFEPTFTAENITGFAVRGLRWNDPEMRTAAINFLSESNARLMDVLMADSFSQLATAGGEPFIQMKALIREARAMIGR